MSKLNDHLTLSPDVSLVSELLGRHRQTLLSRQSPPSKPSSNLPPTSTARTLDFEGEGNPLGKGPPQLSTYCRLFQEMGVVLEDGSEDISAGSVAPSERSSSTQGSHVCLSPLSRCSDVSNSGEDRNLRQQYVTGSFSRDLAGTDFFKRGEGGGQNQHVFCRLVFPNRGYVHHVRLVASTPFSWLVLCGYEGFDLYFRTRRLKWSQTPKSQGYDLLSTSPAFPVTLFMVPSGTATRLLKVVLSRSVSLVPENGAAPRREDSGVWLERDGEDKLDVAVTLTSTFPTSVVSVFDTLRREGLVSAQQLLDVTEGDVVDGGMVSYIQNAKGRFRQVSMRSILEEGETLYLGI